MTNVCTTFNEINRQHFNKSATIEAQEAPLMLNEDVVLSGFADFKDSPTFRSKSGCWKSAYYILAVELLERCVYCGIKSNLVNYLTGPLGLTTAAAAGNVNAWLGTSELSPLFCAFIADAFVGQYRTIMFSSLLYILGLGMLSLFAAVHSINYSVCQNDKMECSPSALHITLIFFSLYLVAFAQAGHRPCLQAFGADQFDDEDQNGSKEKPSFFNWWSFYLSVGCLVGFLVLSYIQENISWELGFAIPCIVMCFALLIFSLGTKTYRFRISRNETNPFARIGWVFVRALRTRLGTTRDISVVEEAGETLLQKGSQFKFPDEALLSSDGTQDNDKFRSANDIEDSKAILKLAPLWSSCLGFAIVAAQTSTLFTRQGAFMDRYITSTFQIPAASLQSFLTLSVLIFLPVYDRIFIPIARTISNKPSGVTILQRIGAGLLFSTISMMVAAYIEKKRLLTAAELSMIVLAVPMSIWWLVPQYMLYGVGYVLTAVGLQEFFYDQMPKDLKSIGPALYLSIIGIGNFLSSFLISVIEKATSLGDGESWFSDDLNRAHIDYFYWLLAGISAVAFAAYVYFAKSYVYSRTSNF